MAGADEHGVATQPIRVNPMSVWTMSAAVKSAWCRPLIGAGSTTSKPMMRHLVVGDFTRVKGRDRCRVGRAVVAFLLRDRARGDLDASFPERCNYAGSVSPKASMILRWRGLVSV